MKQRYNLQVEVIKKHQIGFFRRIFLPRFPAVEINEQMLFGARDITTEELEKRIALAG